MSKKNIAIVVWVVVGLIILGAVSSWANARMNAVNTVGGASTATDLPLKISPTDSPTDAVTEDPLPTPEPDPVRPAGPAYFKLPDFTDMDENEVDSWFYDHNIDVSTEFDYGDYSGSDCEDAGDGIVEEQTPNAGARLKNSMSTDVYFSVYCDS